jgi:8-oxo-dGTP diphosphatase
MDVQDLSQVNDMVGWQFGRWVAGSTPLDDPPAVDPRYKPDWDLPGGMAEANEAPLDAARREVAEKLGIEYAGGRLLVIDWVAPHGPWDDSLAFVFDGGVLTQADRDRIRLLDGELTQYRFVAADDIAGLLRPYVESRVREASAAAAVGGVRYLHNGAPV